MSDANDIGPIEFRVRAPVGNRLLKLCHDEGLVANEEVERLIRRRLEGARDERRWRQAALRLKELYRQAAGIARQDEEEARCE